MKVQLLSICVALIAVSICGAGYSAQSNPAAIQPGGTYGTARPNISAPSVAQPGLAGKMPSAATPAAPRPMAPAPIPGGVGAGPRAASAPVIAPGAVMTTDNNSVFVLQGGMLYKFNKNDITNCGIEFPPAQPCPPVGAGPCTTCGQLTYIPGYTASCMTTTTCTPCPVGSGPSKTIVKCGADCGCPAPATCPTSCQPSCPCQPQQPSCGTCGVCGSPMPVPTSACTTTVAPASMGAGPCAVCPPITSVSACTQARLDCLNTLCGAEADKAYLQSLMQINLSTLALSDAAAVHLGTTRLQNYATNSTADSKSRIAKAEKWLRTKYCLSVTACPPSLGTGFNICNLTTYGSEYDAAYRNQLIQFYVDEIALSQAEIERGLDSDVKAFAARVIKEDQDRITRMSRCNLCGIL